MGLRAEEIAKTLIDIQCEIYERHSATSAPTDRGEYERWVSEATDAVTQLYGNADMGRYGLEFGRACQMATDMSAHIAAEALERSLVPDIDGEDWDDDGEDEVSVLDDITDEIANLEMERVAVSHSVATKIQHVIDVVGGMAGDDGRSPRRDSVTAVSREGLIAKGTIGMRIPGTDEFAGSVPGGSGYAPSFSISHSADIDDDVVSVMWVRGRGSTALASCSRRLLSMDDHRLMETFS